MSLNTKYDILDNRLVIVRGRTKTPKGIKEMKRL